MIFDKSGVQTYTLSHHTTFTHPFVLTTVQSNTSAIVFNISWIKYNPCQEHTTDSCNPMYYHCDHIIQLLPLFTCRTIVGHVTLSCCILFLRFPYHWSLLRLDSSCFYSITVRVILNFLYAIWRIDSTHYIGNVLRRSWYIITSLFDTTVYTIQTHEHWHCIYSVISFLSIRINDIAITEKGPFTTFRQYWNYGFTLHV